MSTFEKHIVVNAHRVVVRAFGFVSTQRITSRALYEIPFNVL
jgi:hypothetical protein